MLLVNDINLRSAVWVSVNYIPEFFYVDTISEESFGPQLCLQDKCQTIQIIITWPLTETTLIVFKHVTLWGSAYCSIHFIPVYCLLSVVVVGLLLQIMNKRSCWKTKKKKKFIQSPLWPLIWNHVHLGDIAQNKEENTVNSWMFTGISVCVL